VIRLWSLVCVFVLCALQAQAQERVLVFPFDFVEMTPVVDLDTGVLRALNESSIDVLSRASVAQAQGLDLMQQRTRCSGDLLCLVQIGELLEATKLVVAGVRRGRTQSDLLSINIIDVSRASLIDSIRWDVSSDVEELRNAVAAAAKQLLVPTDTVTVFEIEPPESSVFLYGRPLKELRWGEPVPFWAGTYVLRVEHPGYEPREVKVTLVKGGTSRIRVTLDLDPLYVQPRLPSRRSVIGRKPKQRTNHVKTALTNPLAWMTFGAGAIAMLGGGAYMVVQQDQYTEVAQENRDFANSEMITSASDAAMLRTELQENFATGEITFTAGALVASSAVLWILFDAIWGDSE
jgi:hypothetical protein